MYAYMKGNITDRFEQGIVLEVCGIGYNIFMSEKEIKNLNEKEEVKIYTYFDHKEDSMRLFGFTDKKSLEFFKKLISVNGVGPKMAIGIIGSIDSEKIATAIATDDVNIIKQAPGVGPKLAAKIIIELKDKISNDDLVVKKNKVIKSKDLDEAIVALKVLGYSDKDITSVIDEIDYENKSVQEIIKAFLKLFSINK